MTQKIKKIIIALFLLTPVFFTAPVLAVLPGDVGAPTNTNSNTTASSFCSSPNLSAAQVKSCQSCDTTNPALNDCLQNNVIIGDLQTIVNLLSGLVGIVVIGTIILGGIQYSIAGGNPETVTKAKARITNGLIALVAFLFIFAFLQWLIPGGIFG